MGRVIHGFIIDAFDEENPEATPEGEELEKIIDEDIELFDQWFQTEMKNSPILKSEWAMLKTYLYWKTHNSPRGVADGT